MASVTFLPSVGGDGSTVSDDSNPTTGLANGGHRTRFVPALAQVVAVAGNVVTNAQAAVAAATTAVNAPGTQATSVTSLVVGTGSKTLTLDQTGKAFGVGMYVQIVNTLTPTQWMVGGITAFNAATGVMTVNVVTSNGSGTIATWTISPATPSSSTPTFTSLTVANGTIAGGGPATSGSAADPNSEARFAAGSAVLDFGAYANGDGWIQSRSSANYSVNYGLGINPNGGRTFFGGAVQEARVAMAASDINLSAGNYFTRTISTTTTLTVSNTPAAGTAASFILDLTNGGAATINWWANVRWAAGTAPTLTASGRDVLGFFTHDGGSNWTGLVLGKDVK